MRRRRTRSRGLWFPTNSSGAIAVTTLADNAVHQDASSLFDHELDAPTNQDVLASSVSAVGGLLPMLEQPGYIPRRIVGRINCSLEAYALSRFQWDAVVATPGTFLNPPRVHVHFGLFIDRVDQLGVLQNLTAWNPFDDASLQKRWLFERDWWLEHSGAYDAYISAWSTSTSWVQSGAFKPTLPDSIWRHTYLAQSCTVDIKPKCKVGYEERLFQQWTFQWENEGDATVTAWTPQVNMLTTNRFRVFGTPIRNARR